MKLWPKLKQIYMDRGILGILFLPVDFILNRALKIFFSRKTTLYINAVDVYQRYSTIAQFINDDDKKILEVGGANTAIYEFLKHAYNLTIIDTDVDYKPPSNVTYILKSANKVNYTDNHFDCVISIAMLEHIPKSQRQQAIYEWKRVGKKILLYVPFGIYGEKYDKLFFKLKKLIGMHDKWTEEHIMYSLPTLDDLNTYFPHAKITFIQNGNVWLVTTFLSSLPVIGRVFPGVVYFLLKHWDKKEPFIGCIVCWEKSMV